MQRPASAWGRAALQSLIAASLLGGTAIHAQGLVHFDLPSQPLAQALRQIGALTNTDILVAAPQVAGRKAPALQADLTTEEALARVLAGAGLKARHVDDHTIVIASAVSAARDGKARPAAADDPSELVRVSDLPAIPEAEATQAESEESASKQKKTPPKSLEEVLVTGTHIRGESPSSQVLTFDQTDIEQSGLQTIGDFLRSIPQNYGSVSPLLSTSSAPGVPSISFGSAPDLRGLGPGSTLTLLNGRRLAEDLQGATDITPIPLGAIQRIEIVPDGASAVYGSDAVAGVVNIILKDRFDGALTTGSIGTTSEGGGTDIRGSQLLGGSWSGGSGLLDYEYEHQDTIYSDQRSFTQTVDRPYTLIPTLLRNSVFGTVHQELGDNLSGLAEGYYSTASKNVIQTLAPTVAVFPVDTRESYATLGLDAHLLGEWRASAFVSQASTHTLSDLQLFFSGLKSTPDLVDPGSAQGRTTTVEAHADGPLPLPAPSPIHVAVGGGERWESLTFNNFGELGADGRRRIDYAFAEAAAPLVAPSSRLGLNRLELDLSGRYEHYSDFGGTAVPKLGLVYVPDPQLTLRSSWGRSYRAPLLDYTTAPAGPVNLFNIADPLSPTGKSNVLVNNGGNPALGPERATTFSASLEFRPRWASGLTLTASYFHILYLDRIQMLPAIQVALTTPADAPLVVRNPSPAMQQALIAASALGFENYTSSPYDPATIAAIIDDRYLNVASQRIDGGDFGGKYLLNGSLGVLELFLDATLLTIEQQQTASAPSVILTGQPYEPPHFRARGGATWTAGPWTATAIVNYLGGGTDPNTLPGRPIASWTTIDARIAWRLPGARPESQLALAVQNLFDRDPPYIAFTPFRGGFNYDPTNVTPLGRFVSLTAGVRF